MQKIGVCGAERTESELARDIWVQVREEAIGAVEHDRAMSEIIRDTVLIHDNFGDALAHRLARKLGDYALSIESLEAIFCEAFAADPGIEEAALADGKVQSRIAGKTVAKVIVVPGRTCNLVVK